MLVNGFQTKKSQDLMNERANPYKFLGFRSHSTTKLLIWLHILKAKKRVKALHKTYSNSDFKHQISSILKQLHLDSALGLF